MEGFSWVEWIVLALLSPLVGFVGMFSGGFWGVGCGWLVVPSMLVFFDCTPMQAAGVGLLQMAPSILGPVIKEAPKIGWGKPSIGRNLVMPMALGAFVTSFCGRPINIFFNELCGNKAIFTFFGIFMFVVGYQTLFGKTRKYNDTSPMKFTRMTTVWALIGGFAAGVFSSVLGVGGAMVFRPTLASGFKTSEEDTARATRFLLLSTTITGGATYLLASDQGIDAKILVLAAAIAVGGAIGFPLGVQAHNVVLKAGYANIAQRSFAVICAIVMINAAFSVLGLEEISRYVMFGAAVLLMAFLLLFVWVAKRRLRNPL